MPGRTYPVHIDVGEEGFIGRIRLDDGREFSLRAVSLRRLSVGLVALIAALDQREQDTITLHPAELRSPRLAAGAVIVSLDDRRREPGSLGRDGTARILEALAAAGCA